MIDSPRAVFGFAGIEPASAVAGEQEFDVRVRAPREQAAAR